MAENPYIFLSRIMEATIDIPSKWMSSGARCFLYSPHNPAFFTCKYISANNFNNVSVATIDANGDTIYQVEANEKTDPALYSHYLDFYNSVKEIAQLNANESFFKTMVTHYAPPNLTSKL